MINLSLLYAIYWLTTTSLYCYNSFSSQKAQKKIEYICMLYYQI